MPGIFDLLFTQSFTTTDSIVITHNLSREYIKVKLTVGGVNREDLIAEVVADPTDPTNKLTVELTSVQSGTIQIFGTDFISTGELSASNKSLRVQEDDSDIVVNARTFNFEGNVTVVDEGSNKATITVGGTGSALGQGGVLSMWNDGSTKNRWILVENNHPDPSNSMPFIVPFDMVIYGFTFINKKDNTSIDLELYKNGVLLFTWPVRNKRWAYKTNGLPSISYSAGDRLSVFAREFVGDTEPDDLMMHIFYTFTSDTVGEGGDIGTTGSGNPID